MERVETLAPGIRPAERDRRPPRSLPELRRVRAREGERVRSPDARTTIPPSFPRRRSAANARRASRLGSHRRRSVPAGPSTSTRTRFVDTRSGERFLRKDIALQGGHNAAERAAAIAACTRARRSSGHPIRDVLASFRGLAASDGARRGASDGVRFYDDSKGTNVGASVTALVGGREPRAVLIAGGRDKGGSYEPLVDALARRGEPPSSSGKPRDPSPPPSATPCRLRHASRSRRGRA
jgi:hypothetical protein